MIFNLIYGATSLNGGPQIHIIIYCV